MRLAHVLPLADGDGRRGRALRWLAVAVWAGVIFGFSSIPSSHFAGGINLRDALLHAAEYAVLAALLRRAGLSWSAAVVVASAYGASDEFHQSFVHNRDASPADLMFDVVGATIGALVPAPSEAATP
jgi:VanZ family protein